MMQTRISLGCVAVILFLLGCASTAREGLDVNKLPVEVQGDYALFARRCSKCHQLARALNSGIDDDNRWVDYVTRMRRQPGSGITQQDTAPILRFLHYYSLEQQRIKHDRALANGSPHPSPPSPSQSPSPSPSGAAPEEASDR